MARLKNYNGHYCESEYEYAFISFLENEGWNYIAGNSIPRNSKRDVLYLDDMEQFLSKTNADLTADEIHQIMDKVRLVGAESEFSTLHMVYGWIVNGVQFVPQNGLARMVALIESIRPDHRAVGTDERLPGRLVKSAASRAKAILVIIILPAALITPHLLHHAASLLFPLS